MRFRMPITFLAVAFCTIHFAYAQSYTNTYQYDALGRIIEIQKGMGTKSGYAYDKADNRNQVQIQRQLDISWQAVSQLPHIIGYAETFGGWAANVSYSPAHMTYGPYTTGVPTGTRTAVWRIMTDVVANAGNDVVVTLDVYDASTGESLASRNVARTEFLVGMSYQIFEVPFTMDAGRAGHSIEIRTYFTAKAYINVDRIGYY